MNNPQQFRTDMVILSEAETARVVAFVRTCPTIDSARKRLGIGVSAFEAARGFGRMMSSTRVRVLEALAREVGT